jgi:hypothetical protein
MNPRQAMGIVADDLLYSLSGKMVLSGMYSGHITIPADLTPIGQLAILFLVEGDRDDPLRSVAAEVTLPGSTPIRQEYPMPPAGDFTGTVAATKWFAKLPFLLAAPMLRPGRIDAKIIHDSGEISVSLPWIITTATLTASSTAR